VTGTSDLGNWWPVLFVRALIESSSLLFSTVWLFAYAYRLNHRLSNLSEVVNVSTLRLSEINNSKRPIQRVVRILLICAVCYTGRIFCLIILISEYTDGALNTDKFSNVGWFFLSTWVPTLIPVRSGIHRVIVRLIAVSRAACFCSPPESTCDQRERKLCMTSLKMTSSLILRTIGQIV
jgi:hypothetical protein